MSDEQHIIKRRIKLLKLRRKARRGEIFIRRVYKILRFFLILFIFWGVYRVSISKYWYLPISETEKNIQIIGNSIVSRNKIINEVKKVPLPDKPIYKINPNKLAKKLEELSPIQKVYIRRFWYPARFVIAVQEVVPAIVITPYENVPEVAAYSFNGVYISREYLPLTKKNNVIKILSFGVGDDDYEKWDVEKINKLYKLVKLVEFYSGEKAKYLDLRIKNNAFIQMESVKIRIGALDLGAFERIKAIKSIMKSEQVKKLSKKIKYVDLSWSDVRYINVEE